MGVYLEGHGQGGRIDHKQGGGQWEKHDDLDAVNADAAADTAIFNAPADVSAADADTDRSNGEACGDKWEVSLSDWEDNQR